MWTADGRACAGSRVRRVDADEFWTIVDESRAAAAPAKRGSAVKRHVRALTRALERLPATTVLEFEKQRRAQSARANRWDLWAAGYVAFGGMSDDSFLDFRSWLISQGREAFERVLADPDSLVELTFDSDGEDLGYAEEWGYVPLDVLDEHEEVDDDELEPSGAEPQGEPFPEDDGAWFAERFPRLWARYGTADGG